MKEIYLYVGLNRKAVKSTKQRILDAVPFPELYKIYAFLSPGSSFANSIATIIYVCEKRKVVKCGN